MGRVASMMLVVALLGGTAAAFAVTEGLKLEKSPILSTQVAKIFSPVCNCDKDIAAIRFRLREPDTIRVEILRGEDVIRTLVAGRRVGKGSVHLTWNGRDDSGFVVREGTYQPRVHLDARHRTILLPNAIRVDLTPPRVKKVAASPTEISPDGDGRRDRVTLRYELSERAHAILLVDGQRAVYTRGQLPRSSVIWNGRLDGKPLPPGVHVLRLAAQDTAGNSSSEGGPIRVRIRYIELARSSIRVKTGTRFGVRVTTDASGFSWRLAARSGTAKPGLLVLRAPDKPGRLRLVVEERGHTAAATVVVERRT